MGLIRTEDVRDMLDLIADSKAITTKHGAIAVAKIALDDIPTIDPESMRPQGEWEEYPSDQYRRCSHCKTEWPKDKIPRCANYCLYCGAKMKGAGDHERPD